MSTVIVSSQNSAPTLQGHGADGSQERDRGSRGSRIWVLIEALAYAGAAIDPAAALAARRVARVRDLEISGGR
jgi:hypothetical protein